MDTDLKKYEELTWNKLLALSFNHIKSAVRVLLILDVLFIISDSINKWSGRWIGNSAYFELFLAHVIFALGLLVFFFWGGKVKEPHYNRYIASFVWFVLTLASLVSGRVDQRLNTEITVYVIACFFIAFFFYQKPLWTILSYIQSFIIFLCLVTINQKDLDILQGHYINSFMVVSLCVFISLKVTRFMQEYQVYRFHLEDLVAERTTELETSLKEVQRLDRLNIVGEMAATVSHEIRNPLTTIRGFLQLMKKKQDAEGLKHFDLMISEIDRANDIISEFLSISRNKATIVKSENLSQVVNSIIPLIEADTKEKGILFISNIEKVPDQLFNRQEIVQLILNLTRNAIDATPSNGVVAVKVCQEQNEILLSVEDQGEGIPSEILEKIGTPFFTTKDSGTGLGLVVCNSIIERHQGRMDICSGPHGSTFKVYFKIPSQQELLIA